MLVAKGRGFSGGGGGNRVGGKTLGRKRGRREGRGGLVRGGGESGSELSRAGEGVGGRMGRPERNGTTGAVVTGGGGGGSNGGDWRSFRIRAGAEGRARRGGGGERRIEGNARQVEGEGGRRGIEGVGRGASCTIVLRDGLQRLLPVHLIVGSKEDVDNGVLTRVIGGPQGDVRLVRRQTGSAKREMRDIRRSGSAGGGGGRIGGEQRLRSGLRSQRITSSAKIRR